MKTALQLPVAIESYVSAINRRDVAAFEASFAQNATVKDIGREIRGLAAIREWAKREIFAVNVSLELMGAVGRGNEVMIIVKIDGTFDRTDLPDPLVMEHCFTIVEGRIGSLVCRLAPRKVS